MADETPAREPLKIIGFEGEMKRASASVEPFFKENGVENKVISIRQENDEIAYRLGRMNVQEHRKVLLEAIVSDSPDGKGFLVTFAHPKKTKKQSVIGVAIAPGDGRPEVDGVWVADEGGGDDEESEGSC